MAQVMRSMRRKALVALRPHRVQQSRDAELCLPCHTLMHDGLLPPVGASLQRVAGSLSCSADKSSDVIHGRRIGTSSLRKGPFLHAPPVQEPR